MSVRYAWRRLMIMHVLVIAVFATVIVIVGAVVVVAIR